MPPLHTALEPFSYGSADYVYSVAGGEDIGGAGAPEGLEVGPRPGCHGAPGRAIPAEDGAAVAGGEDVVGSGAPDIAQVGACA